MSKRDEQIARMKGLMTYGISNASKKTPVTESVEGADGKIYAIIREGAKFYIKSTQKGSELVTESFDYIGGFMNRKNNEFSSYNQASKNLELKLRSINEAYGVNKPVELLNPDKKEELMVEMTDSMKQSLARYRQIMNNASMIMNESTAISASNTGNPEAPKTTSFNDKLGAPFNNSAEASLDKDLKANASNPTKQGEPFGDDSKAEKFTDAKYVPDGSVANKKPSGGKVVRVNENEDFEDFEETIEECEEWGSCGLPSSEGVGEVGDDSPFTQKTGETIEEAGYFHNDSVSDDEQLQDTPDEIVIDEDVEDFVGFSEEEPIGEGEDEDIDLDDIDIDLDSDDIEDDELDDIDTEEELDADGELEDDEEDFEIEFDDEDEEDFEDDEDDEEDFEIEFDDEDEEDFDDEDDEDFDLEDDEEFNDEDEEDFEDDEDFDFEDDEEFDDEDEEDFEDDEEFDFEDDEDGEDYFEESFKARKLNENGTRLNVFGKHHGYRKKVMSLPQTGSDSMDNAKDWNDSSVYSEEPFGIKIGSSAPFDKVIEESIDKVLSNLKKKI